MQRFVKFLALVDDPEVIEKYKKVHQNVWPEITEGIKSVGITRMDIFIHRNNAVMIMELPDDIDLNAAMERLAALPRQAEWEEYVSAFQQCLSTDTSAEKWKLMEQAFCLDGKRKKVFVSGCYDMLHSGHVAFFKEASRYGDLYVGIGSDKTIEKLKNRKTVYSEKERLYMVKSIRYVTDACINAGSGMMDFKETVERIKPDIFVVNSDGGSEEKRNFCKERGIEYVELERVPEDGLEARSTTSLRTNVRSHLPYRVDVAGTWIDQPYVSVHGGGWALTFSIEPTHEFIERGGMSTSTRNAAKKIWPYELPDYNEEMLARILFCFENDPEREGHISGAQDSIGICMSGLNRHYYDGTYWPSKIESCHDEKILQWLENHIVLVEMFPRRDGCSVVEGKDINAKKVKDLTDAADRCWEAIMQMDFDKFAKSFGDSFRAQVAMFPAMMQPGVQEHIDAWKPYAKAWKMLGAGGGGHLALVVEDAERLKEQLPKDLAEKIIPVKIRRKGLS